MDKIRNKPYCVDCDNRIQPGKAYIKKNINSAWYVVLHVVEDIVWYKKIDIMNIPHEKEVNIGAIFSESIDEFENNFEFVSTMYCPYEINPDLWEYEKEGIKNA